MGTKYQIKTIGEIFHFTESEFQRELQICKNKLKDTEKGSPKYKMWKTYHNQLLRFIEVKD